MRPRLAAAALVLPLGLAALAGCSGSDEPAAQEPAVATASDAQTGTDTGEVEADAGEEISAEQLTALMTRALEQATTTTLTMRMTAGGQEIDVTGEVDYTTDPISVRMDLSGLGAGGDMTMIQVDGSMYVRLPARGEDFVRIDLDDPTNPMGGSFTGQLDPGALAEVVASGLQRATYVGEEEVEGETLDHYTAVVDSGAVLAQLDVGPAGEGALPEEIAYDLWFDAEGSYRQMAVDLGAAAGEVLIRFEDWGADVDIEAPPADRVSDMGSAAG